MLVAEVVHSEHEHLQETKVFVWVLREDVFDPIINELNHDWFIPFAETFEDNSFGV